MPRTRRIEMDVKYYPKQFLEKLENTIRYPLTLLEADSGFGKTTAATHFFSNCIPEGYSFFQHEFTNDSPARAWEAFCDLIARADLENAQRLRVIGEPNEDNMNEIARTFREFHCKVDTILFLDDFQAWNLYQPGEFIKKLSRHGAEKLHIVIASHPYSHDEHMKMP